MKEEVAKGRNGGTNNEDGPINPAPTRPIDDQGSDKWTDARSEERCDEVHAQHWRSGVHVEHVEDRAAAVCYSDAPEES